MTCCNNDCRQGRDCPLRKESNVTEIIYKYATFMYNITYLALIMVGASIIL